MRVPPHPTPRPFFGPFAHKFPVQVLSVSACLIAELNDRPLGRRENDCRALLTFLLYAPPTTTTTPRPFSPPTRSSHSAPLNQSTLLFLPQLREDEPETPNPFLLYFGFPIHLLCPPGPRTPSPTVCTGTLPRPPQLLGPPFPSVGTPCHCGWRVPRSMRPPGSPPPPPPPTHHFVCDLLLQVQTQKCRRIRK